MSRGHQRIGLRGGTKLTAGEFGEPQEIFVLQLTDWTVKSSRFVDEVGNHLSYVVVESTTGVEYALSLIRHAFRRFVVGTR